MSWNADLIYYACIAKGTTILTEFNSKDADLGALALKCLEKTPPLHSMFSHTVRSRTYMFLMEEPFTYFGIFDESHDNSDCLAFLGSLKDSFNKIMGTNLIKNLDSLTSHCYQGEFYPVFHQLLASNTDFEIPQSPRVALKHNNESLDSPRGKRIGSMPLLGDGGKSSKKKKKRLFGEINGGILQEKKADVLSDDEVSLGRNFSDPMHKNGLLGSDSGGNQKAKRKWKKQVWVVLSFDLVMCCILFVIWLWICRGFQCLAC